MWIYCCLSTANNITKAHRCTHRASFAPGCTQFAPKCTQCKTKALMHNESRGLYHFLSHSTKKHRNFDTMCIKVAVLSFCLKALISRGSWPLSVLAAARQSDTMLPTRSAKTLGSSRLSFILWVSFNLWAIVYF